MNKAEFISSSSFYLYRIAEQDILFDWKLPELALFINRELTQIEIFISTNLVPPTSASVKHVEGWLFDKLVTLTLFLTDDSVWIEIPNAGTFRISTGGSAIQQVNGFLGSSLSTQNEAILGAPLVYALALQGVWCLHASAVEINGSIMVFLGESGAGKSTLAAFLAQQPGARLVSDDILPIQLLNSELFALPHFPQLKLPANSQPALVLPAQLPISKVYLLREEPAIAIESLLPSQSALTLISHTVAARLFDEQLLSKHFDICSQLPGYVQVSYLSYPRIYSQLPNVVGELLADISKKVA